MWSFSGPSLEGIKNLATSDDTTLEELLSDSSLSQALRYEAEPVIAFLSRPESMTKLLEWSITDKYKDDDAFYKFSNLATSVLTTCSPDFEMSLAEHSAFPDFLNDFFAGDASQSAVLCGHFAGVLEHYVMCTRGEILEQLDGLVKNICEHVDVLAIRGLAAKFLTNLSEYGINCEEMAERLASEILKGGVAGHHAIGVFRETVHSDRQTLIDLDLTKVVRAFLTYAGDPANGDLYRTDAFVVLEMILDLFRIGDFDDVLREFEPQMNFNEDGIVGDAIFRVYRWRLSEAWQKFMRSPTNTFIGRVVVNGMEEMSFEALDAFIQENNVIEGVIRCFEPDRKCAGHLTAVLLHLNSLPIVRGDARWQEFAKRVWDEHYQWIKGCEGYGGESKEMGLIVEDPPPERVARRRVIERREEGFNFDTDSSDSDEDGFDIGKCSPMQRIQKDGSERSDTDDGYEEEEEQPDRFREGSRRTDEEEEQEEEEELTEAEKAYLATMRELLS